MFFAAHRRRLQRSRLHRRGLNRLDRCVARPVDRPARHLTRGAVWDGRRRPQVVGIAPDRAILGKLRHLEREIHAAGARAFDRLDLHHPDAELDRTRLHAGHFGIVAPAARSPDGHNPRPQPASATSNVPTR